MAMCTLDKPRTEGNLNSKKDIEKLSKALPSSTDNEDYAMCTSTVNFSPKVKPFDDRVIPRVSYSHDIIKQAIDREYKYAMTGLIIGALIMIGGILLGIFGVVGSSSWSAKLLGFESNVIDASPGVILFIVGLFIVFMSRLKIKFGKLNG